MANAIYTGFGTPITLGDSGQTAVLTLQNLATLAGRISARVDRGAGSLPTWYLCRVTVQFDTAPVLGEQVEVYLASSDGTNPDGEVGTADAALTTDKRRNLQIVGFLYVDTTSATVNITASFPVLIFTRYFSVGVWNATADALENTANASKITLTPFYDEIQ